MTDARGQVPDIPNNHKTTNNMNPEKLETAERMAQKRRKLQEVYDLLSNHPNSAEIKISVNLGVKSKEAVIREDTFNALVAKLAEDEINNINEFVKSL